jgi:hypothetical protein
MGVQRMRTVGAAALLALGACASSPRLSGAWVGREGSERTLLSFRTAGRGHRLTSRGVEEFRYQVDYTRDPVAIDLEPTSEEGRAGKVLGIVRFDPEGFVQVKLGPPGGARPTAFTRESPGLTLRRPPTR